MGMSDLEREMYISGLTANAANAAKRDAELAKASAAQIDADLAKARANTSAQRLELDYLYRTTPSSGTNVPSASSSAPTVEPISYKNLSPIEIEARRTQMAAQLAREAAQVAQTDKILNQSPAVDLLERQTRGARSDVNTAKNMSSPPPPATGSPTATASTFAPSLASSIGRQLVGGAATAVGGGAGTALGNSAANSLTGGRGIGGGAGFGGGAGSLIGGSIGAALAGTSSGGLATGLGLGLGSFIGGAIGSFLGGLLDPQRPFGKQPLAGGNSKGNNYIDPNKSSGTSDAAAFGYSGVENTYRLYVDLADGRSDFFMFEFTSGSFFIAQDQPFPSTLMGSATDAYAKGNNINGGMGVYNVLDFRVRNSIGQVTPPNPTFTPSPNANTPYSPSTALGSGYDGSPFDALGVGEEYESGTGKRKPKPSPPVQPDPNKPSPEKPRPMLGSPSSGTGSSSTAASNPSSNSGTSGSSTGASGASSASPAARGAIPAFTAKPFVAGISPPSEQNNPVDVNTGLNREEFQKYIEKLVAPTPSGSQENELARRRAAPDTTPPITPAPKAVPLTTPKPAPPNEPVADAIGLKLIALGLTVGAIATGIDYLKNLNNQINQQTLPAAQQTNAAAGACTALNTPSCTAGLANSIVTPVNAAAVANQAASDGKLNAILAAIGGIATLITSKFSTLFSFLDLNAKVESVKSTITLALTLHNALMLSQNLGTTIGAIIDNVLNTFGQTFKTTGGATVSASEFLGGSVKNWIINVIGVDNYLKLSETFAMANRIYQTGINVLSTIQGILDAASSVAQATGINVAKIGNALRDDGTVNPKAYTHMDDSKVGNRPTTLGRFEQLTTTISDFDSKAQNLVTVTAAPIQINEAVKQSKEDIKAFNDARDLNSTANVEAKAAKLEEIKALKAITEAVVSKRDDDT